MGRNLRAKENLLTIVIKQLLLDGVSIAAIKKYNLYELSATYLLSIERMKESASLKIDERLSRINDFRAAQASKDGYRDYIRSLQRLKVRLNPDNIVTPTDDSIEKRFNITIRNKKKRPVKDG